ncbi:hypothetical protein [Chryseobacterium lineare]
MKHLITTAVLLFSAIAFAQVGINNTSPKATLDITAKTNGIKPEGLIIPQLTGDQIRAATTATPTPVYGSNQKGLIIYATVADSAPAGATANITAPGYYYFDGSIWQKIVTGNTPNLYNADGTLTSTRTVNTAENPLKISGGGLLVVQTADNSGKIRLTPADTSHTGHMEVIKGDDTRLGYIGWDNTNLSYVSENGASHVFSGGKVGIGTSSPGNLLEISSSSNNTGLKLPYGAAAGKILTSDASGNSSWQTNNAVFIYSEVHSTGGGTSFSAGTAVNFFHTIKGENIKTIYGSSYGWIDATQRWVAPYTGKYRVTTNMYFNPTSSVNPRLYAYINNYSVCNITSATNSGSSDGTAYTSAIVSLNQGDYIQWKAETNVVLYGDNYHTFIRVESIE